MAFLVLLFVLLVVAVPALLGARRGDARTRLLRSGLEARGLILSASRQGSDARVGSQRYEVRAVTLDVEVPGRDPYELSISPLFPRLCEPFPGAVLDLRVDPKNPGNLAVVGPAGSSAWLGATAGLFPWSPRRSVSGAGCATIFVGALALLLAGGAAVSFLTERSSPAEPAPTATSHAAHPARPHPEPEAVPVAPSSTACAAAARCCQTLGRGRCSAFDTMSESACETALKSELLAAKRLHKTCD